MMNETELAQFREEWRKLLGQTAVRLVRPATGDGRGGLSVAGGFAEVDSFPCLAYEHSNKPGEKLEVDEANHVISIDSWELMTEVTVSLNKRDRVLVDDVVLLEVNNSDTGKADAGYIVWACTQIDLGEL